MKKILMIVAVGLMSLPLFAQTADNSDVLRRADVMPVFKDCEDERFAEHPYRCTMQQVAEHLQGEITITNTVGSITKALLYFVVEKDGTVSNVEVRRGVIIKDDEGNENQTLQLLLNDSLKAQAEKLTFQSPGYNSEGESVRVGMQLSIPINY